METEQRMEMRRLWPAGSIQLAQRRQYHQRHHHRPGRILCLQEPRSGQVHRKRSRPGRLDSDCRRGNLQCRSTGCGRLRKGLRQQGQPVHHGQQVLRCQRQRSARRGRAWPSRTGGQAGRERQRDRHSDHGPGRLLYLQQPGCREPTRWMTPYWSH